MVQIDKQSEEDNTELIGLDFFAIHDPVVEVVVEVTVSNLEV